MNNILKYIILICTLSFTTFLGGCSKAPSNEQSDNDLKAKALSAYQEILLAAPAIDGEQEELMDASFGYDENYEMFGNHYEIFAIQDINQDGIPELLALTEINFRWTPISIYTYADGNAVLLKEYPNAENHGTFEQCSTANGSYSTYICEDNHIHNVWHGTNPMGELVDDGCAYILDGTTLKLTDCTVGYSDKTIDFYDIAKANVIENVNAINN